VSTDTHGSPNIFQAGAEALRVLGLPCTAWPSTSRNTRVSRGMLLYRLVLLAVAVACVIAGIAGIVLAAAGVASVDAAKGEAVVS
jgi:hypothetical protein